MATTSIMLVLYHHEDDVPASTMAAALSQIQNVRVQQGRHTSVRGIDSVIVWKDDWPVRVTLDAADYVVQESQDIARRHAASRPDRDSIATCDRRIEVSYEPEPQMLVFNTWLFVIEVLRPLVHGIVYDPEEDTFPYDDL